MVCKIIMKLNVEENCVNNNLKYCIYSCLKNNIEISKVLRDSMEDRLLLRLIGEENNLENVYKELYRENWFNKICEDSKPEYTSIALKLNY